MGDNSTSKGARLTAGGARRSGRWLPNRPAALLRGAGVGLASVESRPANPSVGTREHVHVHRTAADCGAVPLGKPIQVGGAGKLVRIKRSGLRVGHVIRPPLIAGAAQEQSGEGAKADGSKLHGRSWLARFGEPLQELSVRRGFDRFLESGKHRRGIEREKRIEREHQSWERAAAAREESAILQREGGGDGNIRVLSWCWFRHSGHGRSVLSAGDSCQTARGPVPLFLKPLAKFARGMPEIFFEPPVKIALVRETNLAGDLRDGGIGFAEERMGLREAHMSKVINKRGP